LQKSSAHRRLLDKRLCQKLSPLENCREVLEGRRVVELLSLAEDLWCEKCNLTLSLRNSISERHRGLSSIIIVKCPQCDRHCFVYTNKPCPDDGHSFPVNTKAAMGMIDAGVGESHINTFFSALNVPVWHPSVVKRYERIVGSAIESTAKDSCQETINLEKKLTLQLLEEHDKQV